MSRSNVNGVRSVLGLVLAIGLSLHGPGGPGLGRALAQGGSDPLSTALQGLDTFLTGLEDLRATIDRTQFDAGALGLEMAFEDATTIVDFVRTQIAFEQYQGLLRGPDWTLMSRAGNALDQAVLLASLLRDAGFEARVAGATVDADLAAQLVGQMSAPRAATPAFADVEAMGDVLRTLERQLGAPTGSLSDELLPVLSASPNETYDILAPARADAQALIDALQAEGVDLGVEALEAVAEEARDYYWVEYRGLADEPWIQAHPAFVDEATAPGGLVAQRTFEALVPDDLLHKLRIESYIVVDRLGETELVPVMSPWEAPAATIAGLPITYWNVPDGLVAATDLTAVDASAVAESASTFFPLLMGTQPPGAMAFDLIGNTVPPGEASSPMAGVFRSAGAAAARARSAVGGLGQPDTVGGDPEVGVIGHTLRFTLIGPEGDERTYERSVSTVAGDDVATVRALATEYTIMVSTGTMSPGYLLDRQIERVIAVAPLLRVLLQRQIDPDGTVTFDGSELEAQDTAWLGHLLIYEAFDSPPAPPASVSYRPAPTLMIRHHDTLAVDETAVDVIDVVANERRSFAWGDGRITADPRTTLHRGVWETYAEGVLAPDDAVSVLTPMAAFTGPGRERLPMQIITPADRESLPGLAPDEATLDNMSRDLDAGYVIVLPVGAATDSSMAWWRVDPATGETLGILADGRGGVVVATLALATIVGFAAAFTCVAVRASQGASASGTFWGCVGFGFSAGGLMLAPALTVGGFLLYAAAATLSLLASANAPAPLL